MQKSKRGSPVLQLKRHALITSGCSNGYRHRITQPIEDFCPCFKGFAPMLSRIERRFPRRSTVRITNRVLASLSRVLRTTGVKITLVSNFAFLSAGPVRWSVLDFCDFVRVASLTLGQLLVRSALRSVCLHWELIHLQMTSCGSSNFVPSSPQSFDKEARSLHRSSRPSTPTCSARR